MNAIAAIDLNEESFEPLPSVAEYVEALRRAGATWVYHGDRVWMAFKPDGSFNRKVAEEWDLKMATVDNLAERIIEFLKSES